MSETAKDFASRVASSVEPMDFNSSQAKRVLVLELEKRDTAAERRGFIKGLEAAMRKKGDARRHELRCWPEPFEALANGTKTFEFRKDDRGFAVGDELCIREWDPTPISKGRIPRGYTKAIDLHFRVTYVLHGGRFGVPSGYVVMGLRALKVRTADE